MTAVGCCPLRQSRATASFIRSAVLVCRRVTKFGPVGCWCSLIPGNSLDTPSCTQGLGRCWSIWRVEILLRDFIYVAMGSHHPCQGEIPQGCGGFKTTCAPVSKSNNFLGWSSKISVEADTGALSGVRSHCSCSQARPQ